MDIRWISLLLGSSLLLAAGCNGCGGGPPACTPGSEGCACRADDGCDAPLTCDAGTCRDAVSATGLGLPAGARGCEVLLREGTGAAVVTNVRFAAGVDGTTVRESPRLAITFVNGSDAALPAGAVELTAGAGVELVSGRCVDAAGAALSGAVTLR